MAKLTTYTSGKVEHRLSIARAELIAILREKFPVIPEFCHQRDMSVERDGGTDLEAIVFEWKSSTSDEPIESELAPIKAGCGLRVCLKQTPVEPPRLAEVLAEPPNVLPGINPDQSAFDDMRATTVRSDAEEFF